jgi:acetyl esterase/lipase
MYGRLDGLPPMLIQCAANEILQPQILRFERLASEAGVDVRVVEHERLWHSGHALAGTLREATDAVHDMGAFLRTHLDPEPLRRPAGDRAPTSLRTSGH